MQHEVKAFTSPNGKSSFKVEAGEWISYKVDDKELMHQKGEPGWGNTDTQMFPIIGPTRFNNFRVITPKGAAILDQHGLARAMRYNIIEKSEFSITYEIEYEANSLISNPKYPDKSDKEWMHWPYDFNLKKKFTITDDALKVEFFITAEQGMPYMFGYHPAFKLSGKREELFYVKGKSITLQEVMNTSADAYPIEDVQEAILQLNEKQQILFKTQGFENIMFWAEVPNMVCVEPITQYYKPEAISDAENRMRIYKEPLYFSFEVSFSSK